MCLQSVSLLLAALAVGIHGITFDEYEVVMRRPSFSHANDSEDLFGYSAALHSTQDPAGMSFTDITNAARIVVGVPNGRPSGSRVDQPGYVMVCDLTPETDGRCMPLRGTDTGPDSRLYDITDNDNDEDKSYQFLGVSMESRNGQFAVCAHKWKFRGNAGGSNRLVQGFCLRSGRNLRGFQMLRPCTHEDGTAPGTFNGVISTSQESTGFGFCSSGTDISFMSNGNLIIGAPGAYLWRGVNFVYNGSNILPVTMDTLRNFGYSGMSVRQAHVTSPSKLEWVAGSPRSNNYLGEVFVYDYNEASSTVNSGQVYQEFARPSFTLRGPQIGAYFGYSIAGVDFNGDEFDDVLVGAPLFFKGSSLPEVGAVYIYENIVTNNIGSLMDNRRMTLTAPGGGVAYSRFGHAIASLGDLDDDGFHDVAISAPFGEGLSGTVYIYRGSRQGIVTTPAQTLVGSELNLMPSAVSGLTSFGAYLSASTDIDGNQYNDLVIGAFMSRKVFVIRSRTVATATTSVTPSSTSVQFKDPKVCEIDGSLNNCFEVTYCLSLSGKGFADGQSITVNYTLYADNRTSGLPPRATFASSGGSVLSGQTSLRVSNAPCTFKKNETVYLDSLSTVEEVQAFPLRPAMDVSIPQGDPPPQSDGNVMPIDLTQNRIFMRLQGTQSAQVVGARECQANCSSDTSVTDNSVSFISRSETRFNEQLILKDVVSDIVFSTTIGNAGPDTAYNVMLEFTHPAVLAYSRVDSGGQFTCMSDQSDTVTTCNVVSVLGIGSKLPVQVRFVVLRGRLSASDENIIVSVRTSSSGSDENEGNNRHDFNLKVVSRVAPRVSVSVFPDQLEIVQSYSRTSLPTSVAEIGRELRVNFTVANDGPSTIGQGRLTIHLPYRTPCTRNSFLFYILSVSDIGLQGGQCVPETPADIDPLRLAGTVLGSGTEFNNASTTGTSGNQGVLNDIEGTCESGTRMNIVCPGSPGCVTVHCTINSQTSTYSGQVVVTGFLDDVYLKTVTVPIQLTFSASYQLLDGSSETNTQDNTDSDTLDLNPDVSTVTARFEFWPIIVAAAVAMIFIVIAIIALWACGFFKRRQKWKTQEEDSQQEGVEAMASTEGEVPNGADKPNGTDVNQ